MTYLRNPDGRSEATGVALRGQMKPEILWSVDGALVTGKSHRYVFGVAHTLYEFLVFLDGATGTTDTVVEIRRNNVALITLTLASGIDAASSVEQHVYEAGDTLHFAITTVGTGAESLQAIARFR